MSLGKQAKILSKAQIDGVHAYLGTGRHALRNQTVFLLSVKAGLRAKEIAHLKWSMLLDADGSIGNEIHLVDSASKGASGRVIPLNKKLKQHLELMLGKARLQRGFDQKSAFVISTKRSPYTSEQAVVNMFSKWYRELGLLGCSSHSGRRTFITNAARKICTIGGSLRDVQALAGHNSLAVTQRYIEIDSEARRKIVDLI